MSDEMKLWKLYKDKGDMAAREELLLMYSHLVKNIVEHSFPQLPGYVSHDDLIDAGFLGLIDAA